MHSTCIYNKTHCVKIALPASDLMEAEHVKQYNHMCLLIKLKKDNFIFDPLIQQYLYEMLEGLC